jgi:hypothetical protein
MLQVRQFPMGLHHRILQFIVDGARTLACILGAVTEAFQIVDTLPDLILILRLLHQLICLTDFLIQLLNAVLQVRWHVTGGLATLHGLVNGLLDLGETLPNFIGLHHVRFPSKVVFKMAGEAVG